MRKVLFLITGLDYAGAEAQVVQLASAFCRWGDTVRLVSLVEPVAYLDELAAMGVTVMNLGMRRGVPDPRAILRLRNMIRSYQPDVVHSHMVHANLLARVTRLCVPIPVLVCTAHSIWEGGRVRTWLYRLTDPLCDVMTNVSQEAVNRYIQIKASRADKIRYMPNGIDVEKFTSIDRDTARSELQEELGLQDSFIWFAAGRLAPEKDYTTMLRAFVQVRKEQEKVVLLIAGVGPEEAELKELCHMFELDGHVHFLGVRKGIPKLMRAANAYVMSSKWEGLPMVLLESSASSLPIVATEVGGNAEVVRDRVNGYLAQPSNPSSLVAGMLRMMEHTDGELSEMGRQGMEWISLHYGIEAIARQWGELYDAAAKFKQLSTRA